MIICTCTADIPPYLLVTLCGDIPPTAHRIVEEQDDIKNICFSDQGFAYGTYSLIGPCETGEISASNVSTVSTV